MEILETKKMPTNATNFKCYLCDFSCIKKSNYDNHLLTSKHLRKQNGNKKCQENAAAFMCICSKTYTTNSGLWKHKKKCDFQKSINISTNEHIITNNKNDDFKIDKEFVMSILKQNNELQTQVMELLKKGTHNTTNNNKTFNLNLFLNETCKNAMNIMDFVNSLQLQLCDLEKMGDIGYVNGMSNIIIKNLKDMDVTERPVHCTDVKREVLYVKDEDKWDKETIGKPKIRKAIKYVARKNARLLQEFKEKHPDCIKSESKYSDTYNKLMIEAMGGKGSDDTEQEGKIIKRLAKEITIDNSKIETITS
jgi:hypothetical protein